MSLTARQVGEFMQPRQMIRTIKNPMDKATIVSIYPKEIIEIKETTQPREFRVAPGTYENPSVTVVGPSSWWKDTRIEEPLLEIPTSATEVARSIITDYCNGMLGCDMIGAMPGLFYMPGDVSLDIVKSSFVGQLVEAKIKQDNWYRILLNLADSLWARSNNNPLVIWDEMRLAARELGVDKIWMKNFAMVEMIKCFACGSLRNPEFPICPTCKNVDMTHPRAGDIKIAAL